MKKIEGQKRVKDKIRKEVHCQNPRGEAKEEIIILNQTPAILFSVRSSLHDIIYHRRTFSTDRSSFVIWLNNGYRHFFDSNVICFKRWDD